MSARDHQSIAFRDAPLLHRHRRHGDGPRRYVVFAAGFVTALLLMAIFA